MKKTMYCLLFILCIHCREIYLPVNSSSSVSGMLVVEGFITYNTPTIIRLSRTTLLTDQKSSPESQASVIIEGENISEIPAIEKESGVYIADNKSIDPSVRYRLKIKTTDNKLYVSDYRKVILTPVIDNITWKRNNGVEIFVNAFDAVNNTEYYKWDYEETWEFKSRYKTNATARYNILPGGGIQYISLEYFKPQTIFAQIGNETNDSIYTCWKTEKTTKILTGSTKRLSENRVYQALTIVPNNSWKISYLYSIKINQYGISRECYDFYNKIKKNTESLGSIFDPQPSEIKGNITCVTDTAEEVFGFVEACGIQEKRIFIDTKELPGWHYLQPCIVPVDPAPVYVANTPASMEAASIGIIFSPMLVTFKDADTLPPYKIRQAKIADKYCLDCTLRGTNIKPDFWP